LYPETNQRTLEEVDLLFAAKSPWNWVAEANFERLKAENPQIAHGHGNVDKITASAEKREDVRSERTRV